MSEIIIQYLHVIAIMSLSASLVVEHLLLSKEISLEKLKKILRFDAIYGISLLLLLTTGLLQWFIVGKPASFYNSNMIFHLKFTLFLVMVVLSLFPTRFFLKKRKQAKGVVRIPNSIFRTIRIELIILITIPLLAVIMANGLGIID